MKIRKLARLFAVAMVLVLLSTGVSIAQEKTVVKIAGPWVVEAPESTVLDVVISGFEAAYPQYKVERIGFPSAQTAQQVQTMAVAGTLPDLVITNGSFNAAWKEMGIVSDIRSSFTEEFLSDIYEPMLDAFSYEGELFGLPTCAAPFVLLLRKDLLDEAGIAVPQSYDEIQAAAKALTVDLNGDGTIDRYGMSLMGFPDSNAQLRFTVGLFGCNSPDVYIDENGKYATAIGTEDSLRIFNLYWNLAFVDHSIPEGCTEVDYKTMVSLLSADKVAMAFSGPHTIGNIVSQNPDLAGKFIAVPVKDLSKVAYLNPYGFVKLNGDNDQGAIDFLTYAVQNFVEMTKITKRPPALKSLAEVAAREAPEAAAILDCADYNINYLTLPFRNEVNQVVYEKLNAMMAGVYASPAEAAEDMRVAVQAVLDQYNK